jgi:hypothetical protein
MTPPKTGKRGKKEKDNEKENGKITYLSNHSLQAKHWSTSH